MPVEIFFCYAREDEKLRQGLEKQLRALRRQRLIDIWHDREITAGRDWEREIDIHLNTAQIILLLVSPAFMDSDYCYSKEMQYAMERHERGEAQVIPIILRPVYWQKALFGKLQVLPTDAKPVTRWRDREAAFFNVAEGIRTLVELLLPQPQATILFQENESDSWQGWTLTSDWQIVENDKLLLNDGSVGRNHKGPTAIPPFTLSQEVQNFAIEVRIKVSKIPLSGHFGIATCGLITENGWRGYEGLIAFDYGITSAQIWRYRNFELTRVAFDPGTQQHTYQLEIRGNVITLFVDHILVSQATDNYFVNYGGQIGIWSSLTEMQVSSFKVIAL